MRFEVKEEYTLEGMGFKISQNDEDAVVYTKSKNGITVYITFNLEKETYAYEMFGAKGVVSINIKIHKAITKKVKSLGWW